MCGIFAYLHCNVSRTRGEMIKRLVAGLKRLEYRGYDSAGIAIDADTASSISGREWMVSAVI